MQALKRQIDGIQINGSGIEYRLVLNTNTKSYQKKTQLFTSACRA
jgi:hypothetical protein